MRSLALLALSLVAAVAFAQPNVRVRGTITGLNGDVLSVKSRDGKDLQVHLAPEAQIAVAKKTALADIKPGTYVGVTSVDGPDGRLVAKEVHLIPPQAPAGHMPWDLLPGSKMTNAKSHRRGAIRRRQRNHAEVQGRRAENHRAARHADHRLRQRRALRAKAR